LLPVSILVLAQATGTPPAPTDEIPLPLLVNHAIAGGVAYLERVQRPDGTFAGHEGEHPGGVTALVAFTLARAGVQRQEPVLARALGALAGVEFRSTYSAAVHLLLCDALRDPARTAEARRSLDFLVVNQSRGVWAYPAGRADNSNTQFALLGLRAGRRLGLEVPERVWLGALEGLSEFRAEDGGFFYSSEIGTNPPQAREPNAGMTAAALAGLAVLAEAAVDHPRLGAALEREAELVAEAEGWMERHFDAARNVYADGAWKAKWHNAYLWAVERWCGLTDRARIGPHDWYAEGARKLVDTQSRNGSWDGELGPEATCFALLFLRRATITPDEALPALEARVERARAEAPGRFDGPGRGARRITRWWLAGPWVEGGDGTLLLDPPFAPSDVQPRARGKLAKRDWERVELRAERWTDLDLLTGRSGDGQLWALATRLGVPEGNESAALETLLWLQLDDGWDVWLDGKSLSRELRRGAKRSEDVSVPLRLEPGLHLLTVLVEDLKGMAVFGALLAGRDNGPPPAGLVDDPELGAEGK
jgi:hypothetical protein